MLGSECIVRTALGYTHKKSIQTSVKMQISHACTLHNQSHQVLAIQYSALVNQPTIK